MKEIYLIGLGNPGKKYLKSRHNIGFIVLENLSKKYNSNFLLKDKLKSSCSGKMEKKSRVKKESI